jgi:putative NADPH-quinone reductase
MAKHIAILQGHPDPRGNHFGNALADAYADGARAAGHEVQWVEVTKIAFPLLRTADDFYQGPIPEGILSAQDLIRWADHLLIIFPLWHGHFPASFHAFLEQTFRPGFSVQSRAGGMPTKLLTGKTARIVVTMGMPSFVYRWYYGAHSLKSLKRNILGFSGIGPTATTLIGGLGSGTALQPFDRAFPVLMPAPRRERWLEQLRSLGRDGG